MWALLPHTHTHTSIKRDNMFAGNVFHSIVFRFCFVTHSSTSSANVYAGMKWKWQTTIVVASLSVAPSDLIHFDSDSHHDRTSTIENNIIYFFHWARIVFDAFGCRPFVSMSLHVVVGEVHANAIPLEANQSKYKSIIAVLRAVVRSSVYVLTRFTSSIHVVKIFYHKVAAVAVHMLQCVRMDEEMFIIVDYAVDGNGSNADT